MYPYSSIPVLGVLRFLLYRCLKRYCTVLVLEYSTVRSGQKQAGRVWNEYLVAGLVERGFIPSTVDECVFYKGKTILLVYVDDVILCGPKVQRSSMTSLPL
jgi:hypothetical protein